MKLEVLSSQALPNDCTATGIGNLPHRDPQAAVRLMLKIFPQRPFWPELSTPACGLALISHRAADEILYYTAKLANRLKEKNTAGFEQKKFVRIQS